MLVLCTYFCSAFLRFFLFNYYNEIFCSAGFLEVTVFAILISTFSYWWSTLCDYEYTSVITYRGRYIKVKVSRQIISIKSQFSQFFFINNWYVWSQRKTFINFLNQSSYSASKLVKYSRPFVWIWEFDYCLHKRTPLNSTLSMINPFPTVTVYFFNVHFNIIMLYISRSPAYYSHLTSAYRVYFSGKSSFNGITAVTFQKFRRF